jgi:DNA polymerase III subunit epsilon
MPLLRKDTFVCLDFETTGLDPETDKIIEAACIVFTFDEVIDSFETLIDPKCEIPEESKKIHGITDEMVKGKPTIEQVIPKLLALIQNLIIVGHGIEFDIKIMQEEIKKLPIYPVPSFRSIDTLRLARLYGDSPSNSLEKLREHFNIPYQAAHRAMNDVTVNIDVFKKLSRKFKTTEDLLNRLQKPIKLKAMPLGKHKGRKFEDIPLEYLKWASKIDFDTDLLYSIRLELNARAKKNSFQNASNPFQNL